MPGFFFDRDWVIQTQKELRASFQLQASNPKQQVISGIFNDITPLSQLI